MAVSRRCNKDDEDAMTPLEPD